MKYLKISNNPTKVKFEEGSFKDLLTQLNELGRTLNILECDPGVFQTMYTEYEGAKTSVVLGDGREIKGDVYILGDDGLLGASDLALLNLSLVLQKINPMKHDGEKVMSYRMEGELE
jgi:hypothetical protein